MEVVIHHCKVEDGRFLVRGANADDSQEGTATIAVALMAGFVLPDYPHSTRWLDEEGKAFASWRLLKDINETSQKRTSSVSEGVSLAVRDYRLYLFVLLQHANQLSQTFQYFFPAIVGTLNYGPIITLWLTVPVWVRLPARAS